MGNELIFEGKKYISSKRASQITGYNSDYIGQLCRKRCLECRLVGRTWFVEEKSLSEHKIEASKSQRGRIPAYVKNAPKVFEVKKAENGDQVKVVKIATAVVEESNVTQTGTQAYEHAPAFVELYSDTDAPAFTKKIVTVCIAIILCVFSTQFLMGGNHNDKINFALHATGEIAKEINLQTSQQLASVSSSLKNAGLALSLSSDAIHSFRIQTHKFTLKTYHILSTLPSMFFDSARNMKRIVMRDSQTSSSEMIDNGSAAPGVRAGITVVPSSGDAAKDEKLKQYIKDSFSDETEVMPDNTGTSGVIKPIFKRQNDQDYLYVIVPVKQ